MEVTQYRHVQTSDPEVLSSLLYLYVHIQTASKNTKPVGCFHANSLHDHQTLKHQLYILVVNFYHLEFEAFTVAQKNVLVDYILDIMYCHTMQTVCRLPPRSYLLLVMEKGQGWDYYTNNLQTSKHHCGLSKIFPKFMIDVTGKNN